jgi:hypothetical protein
VEVVAAAVQAVKVLPSDTTVNVGDRIQFQARGLFEGEIPLIDLTTAVTWASSDSSVVEINQTGLAKALKPTEPEKLVIIKATDPVTNLQDSATVTVEAARLVRLRVTPESPVVKRDSTFTFTAEGTFSDGSRRPVQAHWTSDKPGVVQIDEETGVAQAVGDGRAAVRADSAEVVSPPQIVTVDGTPPRLTVPPVEVAISDTLATIQWEADERHTAVVTAGSDPDGVNVEHHLPVYSGDDGPVWECCTTF